MEFHKKIERWVQEEGNPARIFFWVLAVASGVAAFLLLDQKEPPGMAILSLLVWAGICVILATGGISFIRRIQRIGPGGVEFDILQDIERVLSDTPPPLPDWKFINQDKMPPLSPQQLWFNERALSVIFYLEYRGVDPATLSKRNLGRYRNLILWAGKVALGTNIAKAFDIIKLLEPIEPKDFDEFYYLAHAYLMQASSIESGPQRKSYLEIASRLFVEAIRKDDKSPDVFWNLGWIYDELGLYQESINANEKAINLNPQEYAKWAYWTMAISYLKMNRKDLSMKALDSILEGSWWQEIYDDPELAALKEDPKFHELYNNRKEKRRAC